jgi:serine/threonine-protein kinase
MGMDGEDEASSDSVDSFLKAVAASEDIAPESMPERVAHFRVLGPLGRGGMGVVYRAHDETLRRDVALKLLPEAEEIGERRQRFLREARAAAAIAHANVAGVHQVGESDGRVYIAMELIEGKSLRKTLDEGRLDVATALDIASQIARGLGAAHARGLVHRDLKPENVMITPAGVVKLLDFGLAKSAGERSPDAAASALPLETLVTAEAGRILGTPAYMSPEQATGEALDTRSDVFAFGVVLYEMLAGVRPFTGNNTNALLIAIARDAQTPLREHLPGIDARIDALVTRCLAKAREDRYANGDELAAALTEAQSQAIERTTGSGVAVLPGGVVKRSRSRAFIGVGVAALAIAAGARAVWPNGENAQAPLVAASAGANDSGAAPGGSASASGGPLAPIPGVTRIVDLPTPKTDVPEAAAEYTAGIHAIYDNTWMIAGAHFMKAVTLDPAMAEAHFHLSMMMLPARHTDLRRAEYEKAAGLRARMSERDQALLEAVQPYLQSHVQDVREADKRLNALAQRYPKDTDILMWLTIVHYGSPDAVPYAQRALALDPRDPYQWEVVGDGSLAKGKFDEARSAYEQCGKYSIDGAECFTYLGWNARAAGRCEEYEHNFRLAADRNPFWLALDVAPKVSIGASAQAIEETIAMAVHSLPPPFGPEVQRWGFESRRAFVAGDFVRAQEFTKKEAAALNGDPTVRSVYWLQVQNAAHEIDVALETGDTAATQRIAKDFVARSEAWSKELFMGQSVDIWPVFARLAYAADQPPPAAFETARRKWIDEKLVAGAYPGSIWNYAWASTVLTEPEAKVALDALAELGPFTPAVSSATFGFCGRTGSPEGAMGHVYLLAGRTDDAIEHLKRAAVGCDMFDSPVEHVRASLDLGTALEQKGDVAGACDAYQKVLAVWGNAKPRSVTADAARARTKVLACPAK